jgi:hypothetical protein
LKLRSPVFVQHEHKQQVDVDRYSQWPTPSCLVRPNRPFLQSSTDRVARGKAQELRDELRQSGDKRDKGFVKKKTALKKIVANMTMGNDSTFSIRWRVIELITSVAFVSGYGLLYADPGSRH